MKDPHSKNTGKRTDPYNKNSGRVLILIAKKLRRRCITVSHDTDLRSLIYVMLFLLKD